MTDARTPRRDLDAWWRDAVIYQIYPRSFADSDGDGLGDLRGITSRLEHIASLGVDAVWLSPFYPSPQVDAGYDVADYRDVAPEYGTLADFDALVARAHALGLKVVVDLVPNHSSDQHAWFQAALAAGPGSPERARYLFRHSPDSAPNNWGSLFGGSAWQLVQPLTGKDEDRDWWYLHLFAPEQPDFDWTNPEVHEMFDDVLRFWAVDHGVDGFRVDVAHGLVKAEGLPDDEVGPDRWAADDDPDGPKAPDVGPMFDQPGVHEVYRRWRGVLDAIRPEILLVAEAWVQPPAHTSMYVRHDEMSQAFNFDFLKSPWDAGHLRTVIDTTTGHNDAVGAPTTWVLSNHDVVRHTSRFGYPPGTSTERGIGADDPQPDEVLGLERARALTLFALGLPGSAYLYQGEELGLPEHTTMADEARQDPTWLRTGQRVRGRDGCRVPLPWSVEGPSFGFNETGASWLPQPEGWGRFAPAQQDGVAGSTLEMYRAALRTRRERRLGRGCIEWLQAPEGVLALRNGDTVVALNTTGAPVALPVAGRVLVSSATAPGPEDVLAPSTCLWLAV